MKIIFLDEYSVGSSSTDSLKCLGEYEGYEITRNEEEVIDRAKDADVIITNKVLITRYIMQKLPHLKLICVAATGTNNVDLEAARELGIDVRNAVGYSSTSVREATLAAVFTLFRQINYYDRYIKSGDYAKADRLFCFDRSIAQIEGSRWGIIGMGAIGRSVAAAATALGAEVCFSSLSGVERKEEYRQVTMNELLTTCDIISLHCPLNDASQGLIGEKEFKMMRSTAILINVARGGIVDENALVTALNNGEIAAAATDVFTAEPIEANSPFYNIIDSDKLLLSPHNAWASEPSIDKLIAAVARNISSWHNDIYGTPKD